MEASRLEELVVKLKEGDNSVKEEIILGHLGLAIYIAKKYGRNESLISGAFFGLVYGVEKAKESLTDNNITAFLTTYIHRSVRKEVLRERFSFGVRKKIRFWPIADTKDRKIGELTPIEFKEIKSKIVFSDLDIKVLDLRLEGYKNKEIADVLGISEIKVSRIRTLLKERYEELCGDS